MDGKGQGQTHNLISRAHVLKYMQAEYEHSILNVFQVMITNSRVDTRVDVSEQTNGQTNVRKLAHLYGAAEADATKTNYFLLCLCCMFSLPNDYTIHWQTTQQVIILYFYSSYTFSFILKLFIYISIFIRLLLRFKICFT